MFPRKTLWTIEIYYNAVRLVFKHYSFFFELLVAISENWAAQNVTFKILLGSIQSKTVEKIQRQT